MLSSGYRLPPYTIESTLGEGGFGVTYLACDNSLERLVAIKEYLPKDIAKRDSNGQVVPIEARHEAQYRWGLQAFIQEAKTLAKFDHPNIVKVLHFIEANNTAYLIMAQEQGVTLAEIYAGDQLLDQAFFENVFFPILDGLEQVHQLGYIHRDIKPHNIMVRGNGTPVLIDFGSARQYTQQDQHNLTSVVSQGYAPIEQYNVAFGQQGPWTDIYAFAASLHEGIYKSLPGLPNKKSELTEVRFEREGSGSVHSSNGFSHDFLRAVQAGLATQQTDRPQDIGAWRLMFGLSTTPVGEQSGTDALRGAVQKTTAESPIGTGEIQSQDNAAAAVHLIENQRLPRRRMLFALGGLAAAFAGLYVSKGFWLEKVPLDKLGVEPGGISSLAGISNWERVLACFRATPPVHAVLEKNKYSAGETIKLKVNAPESGYLHAVSISSADTVTLLHPNSPNVENHVEKGWVALPSTASEVWSVSEPWGKAMILVLYSREPLQLSTHKSTAALVAELERLSDSEDAVAGLSSVSLFYETCADSAACS